MSRAQRLLKRFKLWLRKTEIPWSGPDEIVDAAWIDNELFLTIRVNGGLHSHCFHCGHGLVEQIDGLKQAAQWMERTFK